MYAMYYLFFQYDKITCWIRESYQSYRWKLLIFITLRILTLQLIAWFMKIFICLYVLHFQMQWTWKAIWFDYENENCSLYSRWYTQRQLHLKLKHQWLYHWHLNSYNKSVCIGLPHSKVVERYFFYGAVHSLLLSTAAYLISPAFLKYSTNLVTTYCVLFEKNISIYFPKCLRNSIITITDFSISFSSRLI